jgi:hypothetical protein
MINIFVLKTAISFHLLKSSTELIISLQIFSGITQNAVSLILEAVELSNKEELSLNSDGAFFHF